MTASSARPAQKAKKAYNNHPHSQSPDPDTLAEYIMCLDGAGKAWLGLMEEDTLFNMQKWEAGDGKKSSNRRRIR